MINYTGMAGYHMLSALNNNNIVILVKKLRTLTIKIFTVDVVMTRSAITEQYAL